MKKVIVSVAMGIIIAATVFMFMLINVKMQFNKHLEVTYPNNHFYVQDLPKIDFQDIRFHSEVFCLDDSRTFTISKSINTKEISDDYMEIKNKEDSKTNN